MGTVIKKYPIERMNLSINMEKTGAHIKRTLKESGYTMREIMEITGITTEQTIYKWYSGKSIPSLETHIIRCKLLGIKITELLVIDGEFDFYGNPAAAFTKSTPAFGFNRGLSRFQPPVQ